MFCWFSSLFCLSQSETGVKAVGVWRCANSNHRPEITWMAEIRMSNKESLENWCLHRWFSQQCFSFSLLHFPLWFVIPFNGTPKLIDSIQSASVSDKEPVSQFFFFVAWEQGVIIFGLKAGRANKNGQTCRSQWVKIHPQRSQKLDNIANIFLRWDLNWAGILIYVAGFQSPDLG